MLTEDTEVDLCDTLHSLDLGEPSVKAPLPRRSQHRITLPLEIVDLILSFVPSRELKTTTLRLLYAVPHVQLSRSNLWKHLRLTFRGQASQVIRARQVYDDDDQDSSQTAHLVKSVASDCWIEDPSKVVELIIPLKRLRSLSLNVGALFSPDILDELLVEMESKSVIESIRLVFNPYWLEKTYYSFLKVSLSPIACS